MASILRKTYKCSAFCGKGCLCCCRGILSNNLGFPSNNLGIPNPWNLFLMYLCNLWAGEIYMITLGHVAYVWHGPGFEFNHW